MKYLFKKNIFGNHILYIRRGLGKYEFPYFWSKANDEEIARLTCMLNKKEL